MALVLLVVVFTMIPISLTDTDREKLEQAISKVDRAIAFAANESILRNSIVRIKFELEKDPMEYSVEYGEGSGLILPLAQDTTKLSLKERERQIEKYKKLDGKFAKVEEFSDSNEPLPDEIYIYGLGTTYYPKLMTEGSVSIYFYPTGERDSSLIIFNSSTEIATLKVSPFEEKTYDEFILLTESELANLEYTLENKTKEVFEKWLKE